MRICSPQLGLSPQSILGGEIYDRQILKYLVKNGFEVETCLPLFKSYESENGLHMSRIPLPFIVPPHLYNIAVLPYLLSLYKKNPFDVLRIHSPTYLGLAGLILKKSYPQMKLVSVYHWLGEGGIIEPYIDPYVMKWSDAIICDSYFMKNKIEMKFSDTTGKVYAIHNGVDEKLRPQPKSKTLLNEKGITDNSPILIYMGLFIERKNPLFLLPLVKKLITGHPNLQLLLCGSGPLEKVLRRKIQEMQLMKHVQIVPPVFGEAKSRLLNLADIYVHPAHTEGFSLAVIEALACGLPVVMTKGFSAAEAVADGINGFLCSTSKEWYQKIDLLIKNRTTRTRMKNSNLEKVQREFKWEIAARKHHSLFQVLVK